MTEMSNKEKTCKTTGEHDIIRGCGMWMNIGLEYIYNTYSVYIIYICIQRYICEKTMYFIVPSSSRPTWGHEIDKFS